MVENVVTESYSKVSKVKVFNSVNYTCSTMEVQYIVVMQYLVYCTVQQLYTDMANFTYLNSASAIL